MSLPPRLLFLFLFFFLSVAPASAQALRLSWRDNSTNEHGFAIEKRLTNGGVFFEVTRVPLNTQTWTDTVVTAGASYTYRVRAYNGAVFSAYSNEASAIPQAPAPFLVRVNFQPKRSLVPSGYLKDVGALYTAAQRYGWNRFLGGAARERQINPDQRLDTFIVAWSGTTATWNYTLPNGTYLVTLASGDARQAQGPHRVQVEGTIVINNVRTLPNQFVVRTDIPITVADGQLTVRLGGTGAGHTMINYCVIKKKP